MSDTIHHDVTDAFDVGRGISHGLGALKQAVAPMMVGGLIMSCTEGGGSGGGTGSGGGEGDDEDLEQALEELMRAIEGARQEGFRDDGIDVEWLRDHLEVSLRAGTEMVEIAVRHQDPELAASLADQVAQAFRYASLEVSRGSAAEARVSPSSRSIVGPASTRRTAGSWNSSVCTRQSQRPPSGPGSPRGERTWCQPPRTSRVTRKRPFASATTSTRSDSATPIL
mgnify:CR=1 FL=1